MAEGGRGNQFSANQRLKGQMKIIRMQMLENIESDNSDLDEEITEQGNIQAKKMGISLGNEGQGGLDNSAANNTVDKVNDINEGFFENTKLNKSQFSYYSDEEGEGKVVKEELENLQIKTNVIAKLDSEISEKAVRYSDEFVPENEDAIKKRKREMRNKFLKKFKLKGGFKSMFRRMRKRKIEYVDFDTDDDEEDLDEVLPFLKGRIMFGDDLEDMLFPKHQLRVVNNIPMFRGTQRSRETGLLGLWFGAKEEEYHQQGFMRVAFYRGEDASLNPDKIRNLFKKITKARKYSVRAYVLRGIKLSGIHTDDESLKTYVKITLNGKAPSLTTGEEKTREGFFPEFYEASEFGQVEMPGSAFLRIEIWESTLVNKSLLGVCEVDLEERLFHPRWHKFEMKPVEYRTIKNEVHGVRGRLEMWIDIIAEGNRTPMVPIFPIERLPFELRVIVWKTTDCVIKDTLTEANDVFVRGGVMRGNNMLETDTHWRCRTDGSFNYRWKFDITLPVEEERNYGEDRFKLQIWDRDLIMPNDLIGETEINLNMHKMLKKAYKRREPVEMRMMIKGSGVDTNQVFFDVYHPQVIDDATGEKITQGKALVSIECLPKDAADQLKNNVGRQEPNFYPTLPGPVGRFSFDIFSPCATIKQIIGPKLCYKICYCFWCLICCAVGIFFGYYIFTNYLGYKIATWI